MIGGSRALGRRKSNLLKLSVVYLLLIAGMVVVSSPFFWMISTSLKRNIDVFEVPTRWIPDPVVWSNYPTAFTVLPFALFIWNTLVIMFFAVIGSTTTSAMAAFAFSRLRWRGRDWLFLLVLATLMLPNEVTMVPEFILFKTLRWVNTFLPLIVPAFFGGSAFNIFLLRQFFMAVPRELDDAARIDGCSRLGIFWRIILPLSKPALAAVVIFIVQYRWNTFMGPLIYLNDQNKFVLALGLRMFQTQFQTQWNYMMAVATVTMLPILLIFYFGQKYFIQGIVFTGVKG